MDSIKYKIFLGIIIAAVTTAAIVGLFLSGTPEQARSRQFDERRVNDLMQISSAIDRYWIKKDKLPEKLEALFNEKGTFVRSLNDPKTGELYEYSVLVEKKYELCAVFETKSDGGDSEMRPVPVEKFGRFWSHDKGRFCFSLEAEDLQDPPMIIPPIR